MWEAYRFTFGVDVRGRPWSCATHTLLTDRAVECGDGIHRLALGDQNDNECIGLSPDEEREVPGGSTFPFGEKIQCIDTV